MANNHYQKKRDKFRKERRREYPNLSEKEKMSILYITNFYRILYILL